MVLVELLTGRKVFSHDRTESDLDGIDEHVKCVAKLAKKCVNLEGKKRPNMKEVKEV
ncbi:putative protein kinase-like domain superfamily [Helianthus anomalus]